MTIVEAGRPVIGGVDTHLRRPCGGRAGPDRRRARAWSRSRPPRRLSAMLEWMGAFGTVSKVGVEGTGAYGAGLGRFLQPRRGRGDRGRPAQPPGPAPRASPTPPTPSRRPGPCSRAARRAHPSPVTATWRPSGRCSWPSARRATARSRRCYQMRQLSFTGPDQLRWPSAGPAPRSCCLGEAAAMRPRAGGDMVVYATKVSLADLGRRVLALEDEMERIDELARRSRRRRRRPSCSALRRGRRHRRHPARGRRRQPRAAALRGRLGPSVRRGAHRGVLGQGHPASPQPRRGPPGQPGPVAHRHDPPGQRTRAPVPTWSAGPRRAAPSAR